MRSVSACFWQDRKDGGQSDVLMYEMARSRDERWEKYCSEASGLGAEVVWMTGVAVSSIDEHLRSEPKSWTRGQRASCEGGGEKRMCRPGLARDVKGGTVE